MAGVFGLIGCIPLSLSLSLPTFFNNNNNNNKWVQLSHSRDSILQPCNLQHARHLAYAVTQGDPMHNTNLQKKRRERENSRRPKGSEQIKPIKSILKPTSPTPSNAMPAKSYHGVTEREIKVTQYCEVLQRGGVYKYRCAARAPRVTRTGTYGRDRAP